VSTAAQYYITTLLVYAGVDIVACWGLNLQFGVAGINNFAFIVFQAIGAYTAAVLSLGPAASDSFQQYVGAGPLPFPLPILAAALAGGLAAVIVGLVGLLRLRTDYQAMVMLVISLIATTVATNSTVVNGAAGIAVVPKPLFDALGLSLLDYQWAFVGLTAVICLLAYWVVHRITGAPLGRAMRAMRDNEAAAAAAGKNVFRLRMIAFVVGGALAAVSGAVLVLFVSAWSPAGWLYPETFVYFAAIIVGGRGNNMGALIGALLVPVAFLEATRFLPDLVNPTFIDSMQWIVIGVVTLLFLWFWPRGVVPERRRRPLEAPRGFVTRLMTRVAQPRAGR
jgi:ABC-type branched-subunit amino acid transport system permease subunit